MSKFATCPYCLQKIEKNQPQKTSQGRHFHTACYQKYVDELYKKISPSTSSQQALYEYICQLFGINELTPFLRNQIEKIFKENKITFEGAKFSLKYFFEIKGNKPNIETGVGIIPYVYEEAKNFYIKKRILFEEVKNTSSEEMNKKEVTVKIKQANKRKTKTIDINNL